MVLLRLDRYSSNSLSSFWHRRREGGGGVRGGVRGGRGEKCRGAMALGAHVDEDRNVPSEDK